MTRMTTTSSMRSVDGARLRAQRLTPLIVVCRWRQKRRQGAPRRREAIERLTSFPLQWPICRQRRCPRAVEDASEQKTAEQRRRRSVTAPRSERRCKRAQLSEVLRRRRQVRPLLTRLVSRELLSEDVVWRVLQTTLCTAGVQGVAFALPVLSSGALCCPTCSVAWPTWMTLAAAALLLSRLHAAHARHCRSQQTLQSILNYASDLMRQGMAGLSSTIDQRRFGKWLLVFVHAVRATVCSREVVHDDLCNVLTPPEFFAIVECKDRVNFTLQVLTEIVAKHCIDVYLAANMTALLNRLSAQAATLRDPPTGLDQTLPTRVANLWSWTFPCVAVAATPFAIPFAFVCGALLHVLEDQGHQLQTTALHLSLHSLCQSVKDRVYHIQHDQSLVRRIMPCGGFSYGSNIVPLDDAPRPTD